MYHFKANPQGYCLIQTDEHSTKIYDLRNKEFCEFDNLHVRQNAIYLLRLLKVKEFGAVHEIYNRKRKSHFIKSTLGKVSRLWAS